MSAYQRLQQLRRMRRVHVVVAAISALAACAAFYGLLRIAAGASVLAALLQLHSLEVMRTILEKEGTILR